MIFGKCRDTIKVADMVANLLQSLKVAQMRHYCEHAMMVLLVVNDKT